MIRDRWAAGLILVAALGAALAVACRDDVTPFGPDERDLDPDAPVVRLTSSPGDDRAPAWSVDGDSVYYTAEGFDHLPPEPGVLVGLPHFGGVARPILRNVQTGSDLGLERWLVAPAPHPDGERIAFAEVAPLWPRNPCPGLAPICDPTRDMIPLPPLREVVLRIRSLDAVRPIDEDPQLEITVPGVTIDSVLTAQGLVPRYNVRFLPHQRLFEMGNSFPFRPSWDRGGDRLVFSDGAGLFLWSVDTPDPTPVPGTNAGMSPAWSPDGAWIAFSRQVVTDSTHTSCTYFGLGICAFVEYTEFDLPQPVVTLIRPDGTEPTELFTGTDPAWAPDGTLYFSDGGQIWRVVPPDGEPTPVPGTEGGIEPAVSPDGRRLAFARLSSPGNHDIWVIELVP